jgi:hypothetical protein
MAIAFRAVGPRLKADVATTSGLQSVVFPTGHAAGDLLLLVVVTDDNTGPSTTPTGWSLLGRSVSGTSSGTLAAVHTWIFYRMDDGSLGNNVLMSFSTKAWPTGSPYVLAFVAAYTGCDQAGPVEGWSAASTPGTAALQYHPSFATKVAGDWLLTLRTASAASARTVTESVAGDVERVDDTDGFGELVAALYDSGAAVAVGAQTTRSTTTAGGDTLCAGGSTMWTLAIKPSATAAAASPTPNTASVAVTAYAPTVNAVAGGWDLCGAGGLPAYRFAVDWDGQPGGTSEDVTLDIVSDISITYGRDQERQLNPAAVGSASFTLNNVSRRYSPQNTASPLYGDLDPARSMAASVVWNGVTYPLFTGKIDDFTVRADFGDRTVGLTFLDGLDDLSGAKVSTDVYASMRTGALINVVLDKAGWTGGRDIDPGATIVKYWWLAETEALSAITDLVRSEGPPAVAYVAPDGTFVFRDRHHRMLRHASRTSQVTFHAGTLGDCTDDGVPPGALSLARPFTYAHGWRDIINSVAFDVVDRTPSGSLVQVWEETATHTLSIGQSIDLTVSPSDPFIGAVTPVPGTDITYTGAGTLSVVLSRSSGTSARLTLRAVGGPVTVTWVQVRGRPVTAGQTIRVSASDAESIARHGERSYPDPAPWAGPEDAAAIASQVLLHYAQRRPTVQIRVVSSDPAHYAQVLGRTVGDRIHITNDELGLDADFFVERVVHTVQRIGRTGKPPVHAVVLGCEMDLDTPANPLTFDKRGAGFDSGVFDPFHADDAGQVFLFDDPVQGQFDFGEFGT